MGLLQDLISGDAAAALRRRRLLGEILRPRRWRQLISLTLFHVRTGNRWRPAGSNQGLEQRQYSSYRQYLEHQGSKLKHLELSCYEADFQRILKVRLAGMTLLRPGSRALCLGARRGAEVRAFRDCGCLAIGLDLNPGPNNPDVLSGDFHAIPFLASSVDVVYSNSLDHLFQVDRVIDEVRRVLRVGGALILEVTRGSSEGTAPDSYASFWWNRVDDVVVLFEKKGFRLLRRTSFEAPWSGEQLVFEKCGTEPTPAAGVTPEVPGCSP